MVMVSGCRIMYCSFSCILTVSLSKCQFGIYTCVHQCDFHLHFLFSFSFTDIFWFQFTLVSVFFSFQFFGFFFSLLYVCFVLLQFQVEKSKNVEDATKLDVANLSLLWVFYSHQWHVLQLQHFGDFFSFQFWIFFGFQLFFFI